MALKPAKDWTIQAISGLLSLFPNVVIKQLALSVRFEPPWSNIVDQIKNRLAILGDSLGDKPLVSTTLRVDRVLEHYEKHNELPRTLVDASIFHAQWYNRTFLPQLLRGGPGMNPATRFKVIQLLRQADRIPRKVFENYEAERQQMLESGELHATEKEPAVSSKALEMDELNLTQHSSDIDSLDTVATSLPLVVPSVPTMTREAATQGIKEIMQTVSQIATSMADQVDHDLLGSDKDNQAAKLCDG
eukprot:jgi/Hompol1/6736/HPOL_001543-RA